MFIKIIDFFKRTFYSLKTFFVNLFKNLLYRIRPRKTFQWIFSAVVWLIIIVYVVFGIYFAVLIYKNHDESKMVKFAVKIYPFPVVIVNNSASWAKEYYEQLSYVRVFSEKTKQSVPEASALRVLIINQLVENIILKTTATKNHITVSDKDVNDAYQKIVEQSGGEIEVKKVLNDLYGMNEKDFKKLIRQQVLKEKIQNELISQVKVAHILIKDEAKANEIANRAKNKEDFAALAKEFSEDTKSNSAGGELGWLARGQFVVGDKTVPEFDEAAFTAKKGDIVGPVKTSTGYEIILIEDKKGSVDQSFESWLTEQQNQAKIWRLIK